MSQAKTLLIVDDDASALRALKRLVGVRQPGVRVLLAENGKEAVAHLQQESVNMVLTDLQMPEMSGFELLAWIATNRPEVRCLPMTAHAESDTSSRLAECKVAHYLMKPIDVDLLNHTLEEAFRPSLEGYVQGVSLPSFLQLVAMERKTCKLQVEGESGVGALHLVEGQLVHASLGEAVGDAAALEILCWRRSRISVAAGTELSTHTVSMPVDFLLMESARLFDEREHTASRRLAEEESGFFRAFASSGTADLMPENEHDPVAEAEARLRRRLEAVSGIGGMLGVAVADLDSGDVLAHLRIAGKLDVEAMARGAVTLVQAEERLAAKNHDAVETCIVVTGSTEEIIMRIRDLPAVVVAYVSREQGVAAMVRLQLSAAESLLADELRALETARRVIR